MTKDTNTQWQKRLEESLASKEVHFKELPDEKQSVLFITSSSDVGVMRNGGRNGARFAPKAVLNSFKKWTLTDDQKDLHWSQAEVSIQDFELETFDQAQAYEAQKIGFLLQKMPSQKVVHLGGGHDHIYPMLKALGETHSKIIVLNIDAHADTRTDSAPHSGTPFRQFADSYEGEFHLFQFGLHRFANSFSTLENLSRGSQHRLFYKEALDTEAVDLFLEKISLEITEDCAFVFSLDTDGLSSDLIEAVSAVNPQGITREQFFSLWNFYNGMVEARKIRPVVGIYEFNPLYDTLSGRSMRVLSSMLYEMLC